ncbi:TPA: hypothetical protein ACX6O9_003894 [Photobacterium damselae]
MLKGSYGFVKLPKNRNKNKCDKKNIWLWGVMKFNIKIILYILSAVYGICMVIIPFFRGGVNIMLSTWDRWQTFNAGMIALLAAVIATYIAVYQDEQANKRFMAQRKRDFIAAKAFLPHVLSDLDDYAEKCINILYPFLLRVKFRHRIDDNEIEQLNKKFKRIVKPANFEKSFQDCIKLGSDYESNEITDLLIEFQLLKSRMNVFESYNVAMEYKTYHMTTFFVDAICFKLKVSGFYEFARINNAIEKPHLERINYYNCIPDIDYNGFSKVILGDYPTLDNIIKTKINTLS